MDHVLKGQFYKGIIRKMTILWSFFYNSIVKSHCKKIWEPQHDHVKYVYPGMWYNEVCYKGTAL